MFHYINGTAAELLPNLAVVDCGGIGFEINTSAYSLSQLRVGEPAKLYTYVYIREDAFDIYGFSTRQEKRCFEMLIGVSGVGPKAALSILSVNTPEDLLMAIVSENEKAITAAPGVGKKLAQRVILELKDKLGGEMTEISFRDKGTVPAPAPLGKDARADAVAALTVLGYGTAEINAALRRVENAAQLDTEQLVKAALKQMLT